MFSEIPFDEGAMVFFSGQGLEKDGAMLLVIAVAKCILEVSWRLD